MEVITIQKNDIKVDLSVEFLNAELDCIACGKTHFANDNVTGDEFQTFKLEKGVFESHKCPYCGCNTFDITCYAKMILT